MPPETEIISCPACRHAVRVPADLLGETVQCPECEARFTAPLRENGVLGEAVLIDPHESDAAALEARPARGLLGPAIGLMLLGVISMGLNGFSVATAAMDFDAFEQNQKESAKKIAQAIGQDPQQMADGVNAKASVAMSVWGLFCAAASFGGGLAIMLRSGRWLAQLGSVLACLNLASCCCIPGFFVGIWGLIMLRTPQGRGHFLQSGAVA